jgi:MFS family permease
MAQGRAALTVGLVLVVTAIAFEALAVSTALPVVSRELHGVRLYGWAFSAFMLANLVGITVGGPLADRIGPARPMAAALALFSGGLLVSGLAPSMAVVIVGRMVSGAGAGVLIATVYVAMALGYPEAARARLFAVFSSAWVIPSLVGPVVSGTVAEHVGWRAVFLGLCPVMALDAVLVLPSMRGLHAPKSRSDESGRRASASESRSDEWAEPGNSSEFHSAQFPVQLDSSESNSGQFSTPAAPSESPSGESAALPWADAVRLAAGAAVLLAGLSSRSVLVAGAGAVAGVLVGWNPFQRLTPPGTLRARGPLASAVAMRGLLALTFFTFDGFLPLTLTSLRGQSPTRAGLTLTAGGISWATGSWVVDRKALSWGWRRTATTGVLLVLAGIGVAALVLIPSVPFLIAPVGWLLAGFGMGLCYPTFGLIVLAVAPEGNVGKASSALQLADMLGVALGTGLAGAAVAFSVASGWGRRPGIEAADAMVAVVGLVAVAAARRLPVRAEGQDPTRPDGPAAHPAASAASAAIPHQLG